MLRIVSFLTSALGPRKSAVLATAATVSMAGSMWLSSACSRDAKHSAPSPRPDDQGRHEDPVPPVVIKIEPNKESIQKNLMDTACVACHRGATSSNRFVDLSDIETVISTGEHIHDPSAPRHDLVEPGCPKQSFLLSIMREGKMPPPPAERPSDEGLKAVEDWILGLKPGSTCDSDEPGGDDGGDSDEPGGNGSGDDDEPGG